MKHIKHINEAKKYNSWELESKIDKILESNIKEIPWEGTDVNKYGLKESILELIYEISPEYRPKDSFLD
jgi:hypothetical protein